MRPLRDADWLSTGRAARLLGVSQDTVARMVDAGELPGRRTPKGYRLVSRAALEALIDGRELAA